MTRTDLSVPPKATRLPSGDQEAPNTESCVTGTDTSSLRSATFQICTSPIWPGRPPVTASFVPSGEKRTDSIRSRHADEPRDQTAAVGFVQQHFVEAGDGQQRAVGRPIERRDHGRTAVNGRMLGVDGRRGIGRRVVFGAFFDPAADERDLAVGQRLLALRHRRFAVARA